MDAPAAPPPPDADREIPGLVTRRRRQAGVATPAVRYHSMVRFSPSSNETVG